MTSESKAGSEKKRPFDYRDLFVDVDIIIFGKKHTIKNFPWCMP